VHSCKYLRKVSQVLLYDATTLHPPSSSSPWPGLAGLAYEIDPLSSVSKHISTSLTSITDEA
jgi:hypothetical protein